MKLASQWDGSLKSFRSVFLVVEFISMLFVICMSVQEISFKSILQPPPQKNEKKNLSPLAFLQGMHKNDRTDTDGHLDVILSAIK